MGPLFFSEAKFSSVFYLTGGNGLQYVYFKPMAQHYVSVLALQGEKCGHPWPIAIWHPSQQPVNKPKCHWSVVWLLFTGGVCRAQNGWAVTERLHVWPRRRYHLICFPLFLKVKPHTGRVEGVCLRCEITVFDLNEVLVGAEGAVAATCQQRVMLYFWI